MKTSARHDAQTQHFSKHKLRCSTQAGFTLLETMVALALCGLIIAALGTATHLYWKYRSLTKGQIHTSHLMRGLTEDFSEVLRSVTPLWMPDRDDNSELSATRRQNDSLDGLTDDISLANSQLLAVPEPVPFVGTPQLFAVLTEHPSSRFERAEPLQNASGPKHVVWWINDGSRQRVSLLSNGNSRESVEISASDVPKGLVRSTISADAGEIARNRSVNSQLISTDVQAMSLRFFDGKTWTTDWSSRDIHDIPLLVEFTLSFTDGTSDGIETPASFVVAIPQGTNR